MIYIRKPFANIGDKTPIPFDTVPSGEVSFEQGYTADYQADQTSDPNAKDIERAKFNWFWGAMSENQKDWQEKTFPDWIGDKGDGTPFAYPKNAIVRATDGENYVSLEDNNEDNPTAGSIKWSRFDLSDVVDKTTDQTIDGIKTFLKSPILPTPTTGTQAVNKDYADLKVALESFTGANQNLTASGYQKLPGGLIIQWGTYASTPTGTVTFPVAFPTLCAAVVITATSGTDSDVVTAKTTSSFSWANGASSNPNGYYIAIGY